MPALREGDAMKRRLLYGPPLVVTAAVLFAAVVLSQGGPEYAHAHECPCPPGCIPSATAAPGPVPTPRPTVAPTPAPGPTKIVCDSRFSQMLRTPIGPDGKARGGSRVIADGETLVGCVYAEELIPAGVVPRRIDFSFYDESDKDCGNLRMGVRQMCGAMIDKPIAASYGLSNGGVPFTSRVGRNGVDPARVCRGLYIVTVRGGPTPCNKYLISWGWQ